MFKLELKGKGLPLMSETAKLLGSDKKAANAYIRALNDVGRPAIGKSIGATAKQMGVSRAVLTKRAQIKRSPAKAGRLAYSVNVAGGYLLMKDFRPVQSDPGVRASPWGQRRMFGGLFIAGELNGNVFRRTGEKRIMSKGAFKGKRREVIANTFGPAVPKEMIKGNAANVWTDHVESNLEKRLQHHIKQIAKGVLS